MAIVTQWDNDTKTIIRHDFSGKWTWDEFLEAAKRANELMDTVLHRVDVIANMRDGIMPHQYALPKALYVIRTSSANMGVIVMVVNPILAATSNIFKKISPEFNKVTRAASSLEAARKLIADELSKAERVLAE